MRKYAVSYAFLLTSVFAAGVLGQVNVTGGSGAGSYATLAAALGALGTGNYRIEIYADQDIGSNVITSGQNITLASVSGGLYSVRLSSAGALFRVSSGAVFNLNDNVTLTGRSGNNAPVVLIDSGGVFNMNGGVITGNTVSSSASGAYRAGGVGIGDGGIFNMSGGTISGNEVTGTGGSIGDGGGVLADGVGSVFNMSGGVISGNKNTVVSSSIGNGAGGVYMSNGTFTMSGGIISGNEQSGTLARAAGGVYIANSSRFNMYGGTVEANVSNASSSVGNGDGVFVIGTASVRFANDAKINDGLYTGGALSSSVHIDPPGLDSGALITVQGCGSGGIAPNANITGTNTGVVVTEDMANAFVSKDGTMVGTVSGSHLVWAEDFDITLDVDNIDFGSAVYGQSTETGRKVTVSNAKRATGPLAVTLSGTGVEAFELSKTTIENIEINGQDDFVVKTKGGLHAGNYTAVVTVSGSRGHEKSFNVIFEVTKANLDISVAEAKTVYGEDQPGFTVNYSGFVNGETPANLVGNLQFEYVGNPYNKGSGAGNYTFTPTGLSSSDYDINFTANTLTVEKRAVLIEAEVSGKVYDGNTSAVVLSAVISNRYGTDDVAPVWGTAKFTDKSAGESKSVTFDGWSLSGAKVDNYHLIRQPEATADITPKPITVSSADIVYDGKTYDGTTKGPESGMITLESNAGVIGGDILAVSFTSAVYDNKNVGSSRNVTFSGLALRGLDAGNYRLSNTAVVKSNVEISKRKLVLKADNKLIFIGDPQPQYTYTLAGIVNSETVTAEPSYVLNLPFNSLTEGMYTITPSGAVAANYDIEYQNGILTVSGKIDVSDNIAFGDTCFVYNGKQLSPSVTVDGHSNDGLKYHYMGASDTGGVYDNADHPPTDAGKYIISVIYEDAAHIGKAITVFTISPKPLTISGAAHTKVYDGARSASGVTVTLDGIVSGDDVSPDAVTAMYTNQNAGTDSVRVTSVTLKGGKRGNYTVNVPSLAAVEGITRKPITSSMFTIPPQIYTGRALTPIPAAFDVGDIVTFDIGAYSNNTEAGSGTVEVSGTGNYTGTLTLIFSITDHGGAGKAIGTVTISSWTYGETAGVPELFSPTNGTDNVRTEYKPAGAADDDFTTVFPKNAGQYTIRAVFAATKFYPEFSAAADFTIFKARQERPYIPGIAKNVFGTVLRGLSILPDGVEGIAADRSGLEDIGVKMIVTTAAIVLQTENSTDAETEKWEYSVNGGGQWSDSASFGSLEPNSEYALLIRKREDVNHFHSDAAAILIRTLAVGRQEITDYEPEADDNQPSNLSKNAGSDGYNILLQNKVVSGRLGFTVTTPEKTVSNVVIYDPLGNTVFRKSGVKSNETVEWNLLRSGVRVGSGSYLIVGVSKDKKGKAHKFSAMFGVRK